MTDYSDSRRRREQHREGDRNRRPGSRPPLQVFTTTLWEYPSQHFDSPDGTAMQGDKSYVGATPSWLIWQLLTRYTREKDLIVDPMCGSGTTMDVARGLQRRALGYDLAPTRDDIFRADARKLPLEPGTADFAFVDPPYSTHVDYSDDPRCIGKLDAGGDDGGQAYYTAMTGVIRELHRVLRPQRYMALYVSDSWRKRKGDESAGSWSAGKGKQPPSPAAKAHATKGGIFMPIGFELFSIMRTMFTPVDIIAVVRHNEKLKRGNWHKAAEEGNFFLRGFNYLFVMKKE
ncbi:MAG: DNA methylase [Pyrinomonadaceae bacterium]|nr:DNA methylase [Phycisphaerales bacterium]